MKKTEQYINKHSENNKPIELPQECVFCYRCCGNCDNYGSEGWHGFCEEKRRRVSSTDPACASYR